MTSRSACTYPSLYRSPVSGACSSRRSTATRPLTGAERQSARAGGPRGRADRAKSTSRRTYCARNLVVSEFSPAAQSLETSGYCRSGAVTTQPRPGPPAPSSGRCAKCLKGGTGRAPHRAPQAEPGADCPFVLAVAARQCDPDWCASAALSGGLESRHAAPAATAETRFPVSS